jgi:molybdopterin converting factor small subunit
MPEVTVQLPGLLETCTGGKNPVTVEADTLADTLERLFAAYPLLRPHILDDRGSQRQHVLILFNDQNYRWFEDPAAMPVEAGAQLTILQLVSGG